MGVGVEQGLGHGPELGEIAHLGLESNEEEGDIVGVSLTDTDIGDFDQVVFMPRASRTISTTSCAIPFFARASVIVARICSPLIVAVL